MTDIQESGLTAPRAAVYLAGFDVFAPDALVRGELLKRACEAQQLVGKYPMDNHVPARLAPRERAEWICRENMEMIRTSNGVVANLNSFRGYEPDSGTVFEIGFAIALGKPVWAYLDGGADVPLKDKVPQKNGVDDEGYFVEDFGLPANLMIACNLQAIDDAASKSIARAAAALLANIPKYGTKF